MKAIGYIKLPRAIKAQRWYRKPACRLVALHLLLECSYRASEEFDAGVLLTTVRSLANEVGISYQECRTAISTLEASGFLKVSTVQGKGIALFVTWQDYTYLRDDNIMLNNAVTNAVTNAVGTTVTTPNPTDYNDEKFLLTQLLTQSSTNIKNKDINNTHTRIYNPVSTKSACAAHTYAQGVGELVEWMARYTPEILQMEIPLSPDRIEQMLKKYSVEDIKEVLSQIWSKRAYLKHRSAWQVFKSFARNYRQPQASPTERLYSYDEVCDYVTKFRCKQEDVFQIVPQPSGLPKWRKIA